MHCITFVQVFSWVAAVHAYAAHTNNPGYLVGTTYAHNAEARESELGVRDTSSIPRPPLGDVPYGTILNNCVVPGVVALTFDDGPSQYTTTLLDMLKTAGVPATFFITGANNGKGAIDDPNTGWGDIVRRTFTEGHQIASHTWTHPYLDRISSAQRIQEMIRNEQAFVNILGFFPTYMRPPYTFCSAESGCLADMAALGYHIVNLNLDTHDWQNQSPELIVNSQNTVAAALKSGNVATSQFLLLEHDTHEQTVEALVPSIIQNVKARGYRFVRVGECFNDPPSNWYRNVTDGQAENPSVVVLKNQASSLSPTPSTAAPTTTISSSVHSSNVAQSASTSSSRHSVPTLSSSPSISQATTPTHLALTSSWSASTSDGASFTRNLSSLHTATMSGLSARSTPFALGLTVLSTISSEVFTVSILLGALHYFLV